MLKIGITGGIGAGKSIITRVFSVLGAPVYDADRQAKWLMDNDPQLKENIIAAFGDQAYNEEGNLNRTYLAEMVFEDADKVATLNQLVHPAVGRDFERWVSTQSTPYIIKEAALLVEAGSYKELDKILLVTAPEKMRIRRVMKRDPQRKLEQVQAIISRQLSDSEKMRVADYVIKNDHTGLLVPQLLELHHQWTKKSPADFPTGDTL